jgi:hypothetical protein
MPSAGPFSVVALGWGLSAALVVLFVLCLIAALLLPMPLAHGWIGLFTAAPVDSARVWIEGILYSIAFGWITAIVLGTVYNRVVAR